MNENVEDELSLGLAYTEFVRKRITGADPPKLSRNEVETNHQSDE